MDIGKIVTAMDRIRDREEEELRKLCENPTHYDIAQKLTDAMLGNLLYLCNFKHLVNGNDGTTDIQEVITQLQEDIRKTFRRLTGKEYIPAVVRHHEKREQSK